MFDELKEKLKMLSVGHDPALTDTNPEPPQDESKRVD